MKKTLLIILLCLGFSFCSLFAFGPSRAQNKPANGERAPRALLTPAPQPARSKRVPELVKGLKAAGKTFGKRELFLSATQATDDSQQLSEVLSDGTTFDLDKPASARILQEKADSLTLPLPDSQGGIVELELVRVDIFSPGFSVKTSTPTSERLDESLGVHYRGIVKGDDGSLAAVSVFKNEVAGFYSTTAGGNSVLGRLGGNNPADKHVLYAEKDLKAAPDFHCDTDSSEVTLPASVLQEPEGVAANCVRIYLEANYDLYLNKGSAANTTSFLTALFNQSATLFSNEGISVSISEIYVWNSQSPYNGATSRNVLDQFGATRTSFNGDLAHLITLDRQFGGIAWIDILCNRNSSYAVSDIDSNYQTVPTYSWSVYVFTHEMGHNLGSPHTHACKWNGNNTAIDGCATADASNGEGTCPLPAVPSGGGTIMSYCHQKSVGINFSLGFGPQPKNLILNRFNAAACLSGCGGGYTIGQNAPNPQLFINAANRSNFLQYARQPPTSPVYRWNCTTCDPGNSTWGKGLIQDFDDVTPGVHDALMLADTNTSFVAQIYGGMWDKFVQLGGLNYDSANARMIGYPVADRNCGDFNGTCFTDSQLVSPFGTSYHYQRFQGGAFVMHRSGTRNGQTFEVHGAIRSRWQTLGGPDGSYGLPVSDEFASQSKRRSDFEGGSICYNPSTGQTEAPCAAQTSYTITVSASPSGGGTVGGGGTFTGGTSRTVTASANSGYTFTNWTENGSAVSTSASYTFTLNSNRTLVANFTANPVNYTITLSASPTGAGSVSGGGTYAAGSSRTVTANANAGYAFANWTEGGGVVSASSSYTFTLNSNRTLVANFTSGAASYDSALKAPKCGALGAACDSGTLLDGRDGITGGPEPNQPNTIYSSCPDNTDGSYHVDESIDRIKVSTVDGGNFAPGKTVRIEVTVWAFVANDDYLDLFYAPDATNPNWTYLTSLYPTAAGAQTLSTTYVLPDGGDLQAVRANFLYKGALEPCAGGGGTYADHDDLVFKAQATTTTRALAVASSNPNSGVNITVSPSDNAGLGAGTTPFTRTYNANASVSLTAPASAGGNAFQKWQRDGSDYSTSLSANVSMDAGHTLTAVYAPAGQFSLSRPAGRAGGGQQVKLTGTPAGVSSVLVGGVSASWSYTSGTSEITFTTPPHTVGAVGVELALTSGGTVSRQNAFAYLPTTFTDNVLTAGVTTAKVQHVLELRQAVDALRTVTGLPAAPWTDPVLLNFVTPLKPSHIQELRAYLEDAAARLGYPATTYTEPSLGPGSVVKRVHIEELRQRVRNIAG